MTILNSMFKMAKIKIYFIFFFIILNGIIYYAVCKETRNNILRVSFLDVGQGDAILIESPIGNQLLIDGGPDKSILSALGRNMPFYDRSIDAVLISHPDLDHIGGIPEVLKKYKVGEYLSSGATSSTNTYVETENDLVNKNIYQEQIMSDEIIDLGGGALLKILYPKTEQKGKDTNEYSIVAKLYYGKSTFLFTGDAPTDVEDFLSKTEGKELKSDVLKVAHHGSVNSLSDSFLSAVAPEYSVISAGRNNRYGHPHKEIVNFLNEIKTEILGTYDLGDIIFASDGERIVEITE